MLKLTHTRLIVLFIAIASLSFSLLGSACKNGSVVSDSSAQNAPVTPANAPASATQAAGTSPATAPTTTGAPAASPEGGKNEGRKIVTNIPLTVTTAKPPATPEPDPYPPRPTPTIVIKDGKIVQQWQASPDAAKLANPVVSNDESVKVGREFYLQVCAACHGKSGQGNGPNSVFPKRDGKPLPPTNLTSKVVQANSDGELFWKITNGRSPMPAHRVRLDDEQRWQIVTFLRTLKK